MGGTTPVRSPLGELECRWLGPLPDAAPTLVFLHDGLGSVGLWRDFPAALCAALDCGGLVYSRLGHGGSGACPPARPSSFMHDEALGPLPWLLERFQVRRHALVGHSDGGSIALLNAALAPAPGLRAVVTLAAHAFCEPLTQASIAAARVEFDAGPLRARLERHHGHNAEACFRGWSEAWLAPGFAAWDIRPQLRDVRVPVLALQGEDDEYGTVGQLAAIAQAVGQGARTELLPGCGHSPHRDRPDAVIALVSGFLGPLLR